MLKNNSLFCIFEPLVFLFNQTIGDEIIFHAKFKQILSIFIIVLILFSLIGTAAALPRNFIVVFEYDEETYYKKSVPRFTVMSEVEPPEKEGYIFGGWYLDRACTQPYDFSQPVNEGFYLYPKWISKNGTDDISSSQNNSPLGDVFASGYTKPISSDMLAVILVAALVVCFGGPYLFSKIRNKFK